ncbi:MAG TPA: four-carbon acid sugar kinase family protein, partial [Candidatus Elarobacter sp.]|nr:four-carbon acid sugar kinase family protein [Candidatus Elarobacter sp.]
MNSLALGVVADDFTGATDIANTLALGGMRTVLTIGPPRAELAYDDPRALVVALKTRSVPPPEAVARSIAALEALLARGARRFVFKYCSTFDSTAEGNIGPVADALRERLGAAVTLHCPAFPANGRRVFGGYLFVGDVLLSESGMRDHPLNPMHDANLVRVLQRQTPHRVERLDLEIARAGRAAIAAAIRGAAGS